MNSHQKQLSAIVITGTPGVGKHTIGRLLAEKTGWPVIDINESARGAGLFPRTARRSNNVEMVSDNESADNKSDRNYGSCDSAVGEDVINGRIGEYFSDSIEVDTDKLSDIICLQLKDKERCIVVGHLAPHAVPAERVMLAVILRRSPQDLARIYKERRYTPEKTRQNTGAEILGILAHDTFVTFQEKTIQFDTTYRRPEDTVRRILDAVGRQETDGLLRTTALPTHDAAPEVVAPKAAAVTDDTALHPALAGDVVDWLGDAARDGTLETFFPTRS